MPEFCTRCNHETRDHSEDGPCIVEVARLHKSRWSWEPCPCDTPHPRGDP